jgi:SAM-dependent methyltransferase
MRARGRQPLRGGAVLKKGTPYDDDFFSHLHAGSLQSARAILPRVLELTSAASVVDVGCGSGSWMRALGELGVTDVWGVDGSYAPADVGTYGTFVAHDLRRPLRLSRRFDLAICLEVAEHLPAERATGLVADLVEAAPAVLFSAAIPGQGGTGHINLRWSDYWVSLFESHRWTCWDAIRPWIRTNDAVYWWYRQNTFLAADPTFESSLSRLPRLPAGVNASPVDYLHRSFKYDPNIADTARHLGHVLRRWAGSAVAHLRR